MIRTIRSSLSLKVSELESELHFAPLAAALRDSSLRHRGLASRRIINVNSTEHGGGVAEMLPSQIALLRDLGFDAHWLVIEPAEPEFFKLTKRLHNALHGKGLPELGAEDRALYEKLSKEMAAAAEPLLREGDVLIVHDPQPAGMGALLRSRLPIQAIWRCHVGLDEPSRAADQAWAFLRPHLRGYDHYVFSIPEYVPPFLSDRSSTIAPAIDPLSHKNRELNVHAVHRVLRSARLLSDQSEPLHPYFSQPAQRFTPSGLQSANHCDPLDLLGRPVVTQISRWDHLKGFAPLLDAFVLMKKQAAASGVRDLAARRVKLARLVLAGPDPSSIADDPEGNDVFAELSQLWTALDPELQCDVALLALPMDSRDNNALIVNALQRCSSVVVQNSLREGFGLTATEAMLKGGSVLGTRAAGLRAQIADTVHGRLVAEPEDPHQVAAILREMLDSPEARSTYGRNARRRAAEHYITPSEVRSWLDLIGSLDQSTGLQVSA